MMREKKDIKPVLLKFGVVLAFSLGGILYSIIRNKRIKLSRSPSSNSHPSPEHVNQVGSCAVRAELTDDDDYVLQKASSSSHFSSIEPGKDEDLLPSRSYGDNCASSKRSNGDNDVYLLPEFNDLIEEFDLAAMKASFSPRKEAETPVQSAEMNKHIKKGAHEGDIRNLRKLVKNLKERERSLEIQLLEYYGLKEQETVVMELQNRLKINNMEAKLFNLKIDSLQADKKRLEEQVADYVKVVSELEAAKAKITLLKKKLRSEAEQNREQILALQERVVKLQKQEHEALSTDSDVQLLQKLKDVEEDAKELRKSNRSLMLENSALAEKLERLQNLANSFLEDEQTEELKTECQSLRQQNEELTQEIERLQADRCSDIEELVYLRWINACLRYELRNNQPGPGETVARDLSKSLSPRSEEKAKQLILEYAHREGTGEKGIGTADLDFDQWSSSQASFTDSGEYDDSSVDNSSQNKTNTSSKSKMFGKLMKLLRGKGSQRHTRSSSLEASTANEDMAARNSSDSPRYNSGVPPGMGFGSDGLNIRSRTSSRGSSRLSLDFQRSSHLQGSSTNKSEDVNYEVGHQRHRSYDVSSSSCVYKAIGTISERGTDSPQEDIQKSELVKYAYALKDSRRSSFHGRSASFSSF